MELGVVLEDEPAEGVEVRGQSVGLEDGHL